MGKAVSAQHGFFYCKKIYTYIIALIHSIINNFPIKKQLIFRTIRGTIIFLTFQVYCGII